MIHTQISVQAESHAGLLHDEVECRHGPWEFDASLMLTAPLTHPRRHEVVSSADHVVSLAAFAGCDRAFPALRSDDGRKRGLG